MDPAKSAKPLSLGYGFVQFASKEVADAALKTLQLSKLDEHSIELKRSNRTTAYVFFKIFKLNLKLILTYL